MSNANDTRTLDEVLGKKQPNSVQPKPGETLDGFVKRLLDMPPEPRK